LSRPVDIERDVEIRRPVLSMRTKVFLWGTCLLLLLGMIAYTEMPHYIDAVRGKIVNNSSQDNTKEDGRKVEDIYVTLFRDDFDSENLHWNYAATSYGYGSANIRDGSLFLNLTKSSNPNDFNYVIFFNKDISKPIRYAPTLAGTSRSRPDSLQWLYTNMEIKLRYIDKGLEENKLGEGMRAWGFTNEYPYSDVLELETWSDKSDQDLQGFWAQSDQNNTNLLNTRLNTADINFGEWHIFKINWEPDNATFLVDDRKMATTHKVPDIPLGIAIYIENLERHRNQARFWELDNADIYSLPNEVSIQVDYIRLYVRKTAFDEMDAEISLLISQAQDLIQKLQAKGEDTEKLDTSLAEAVENWRENHYVYLTAKKLLKSIIT